MKSIHFKPLTENDLPLLHDWFQKPHVKQWYARGENYTIEMIREKYLPPLFENRKPLDMAGIDLFIAEEAYL